MQAVKQPGILESFYYREALKMKKKKRKKQKSYTYKTYVLHKTSCAWDQNLGINGIEALTGDWEELNKEIYVCNVCLQSNIKVYCYTQI